MLDSYPASQTYLARFHAKKLFKFRDALLATYHRNEVNLFSILFLFYGALKFISII